MELSFYDFLEDTGTKCVQKIIIQLISINLGLAGVVLASTPSRPL